MVKIRLIPIEEFHRIRSAPIERYEKFSLIADMCRVNTLSAVKRAGSGHLGSSLSAMDIVVWLYYQEMNTATIGFDHPDRDIYFSSKGHDVPGVYSTLFSLGVIPLEKLFKLRRRGGLDGHPHVSTPGIEANSGSLGMGISKAKGMAFAKKQMGRKGRIFVLTGDGELQEGQIYEALQTAVHQGITSLNVIVDHNKIQSDQPVKEICDLGDIDAKFRAFGWHVARCNGHDFRQLERVLTQFNALDDRPKILIADTIKGRGVSFMEHPTALATGGGYYRWHSGAPDDASFERAFEELVSWMNARLNRFKMEDLKLADAPLDDKPISSVTQEYVADAFGEALVEIGGVRKDLIVLDADLAGDCRLRGFEAAYPDRFIENGIAEQDMVSMAGGIALQGGLPVVNTFAAFLAARANEQIYTNACEGTKIIYVCHYSGLIPAGPGASHQSIRDISLFGALPNFEIVQPLNALECKMILDYCINRAKENCMIRLAIGPSPRIIELPKEYRVEPGKGVLLRDGRDAMLFAYGPVMIHEALTAADILKSHHFSLQVVHMPWLNQADHVWLERVVEPFYNIYVLDDHSPVGGLGDFLLNRLSAQGILGGRRFQKLSVEGFAAWGTPPEVLQYHRLDGASLAEKILNDE